MNDGGVVVQRKGHALFISKLVFGVGDVMTSGWSCVLVLFVMLGFGSSLLIKNGGAKADHLKLKVPVFGKLGRMVRQPLLPNPIHLVEEWGAHCNGVEHLRT